MIEFPNHSRSYDRTRRAVRFWGYDSAIEASFFIDEGALRRLQPDARLDESGFLNAFDSNRDLICAAAASVYVRGSRGSYDLVAANFLKRRPSGRQPEHKAIEHGEIRRTLRGAIADQELMFDCVKKTRERHAVGEMRDGPSESPCRRRLQTAMSCFGQKPRW
jgi:hypothetical protein